MLQSMGSQRVRHDRATELTEKLKKKIGVRHRIAKFFVLSS